MKEITERDYKNFIKSNRELIFRDKIGRKKIKIQIGKEWEIPEGQLQPQDFKTEDTSVWSFPRRGNWATHKGNFRGNWSPQVARNLILRYSKPQELVLDQMCGSGTTLVECKLLGRNAIGVDINPDCIFLTRDRLNFSHPSLSLTYQKTFVGDARNLDLITKESVDLIMTHPPYINIIPYSKGIKEDLSNIHSLDEYAEELRKVAKEGYRVLKSGRYFAILIGDTRRNKNYIPVAFKAMNTFLEEGFILKEDIIKVQWRCKATPFWVRKSKEFSFLLLMHEHLFIFKKPE